MTPTPDISKILAANAKRRRKLAQWLARNPLSAWRDPEIVYIRTRASDGMRVPVKSGGAALRAATSGEQICIPPPNDFYPDPITHEDHDDGNAKNLHTPQGQSRAAAA